MVYEERWLAMKEQLVEKICKQISTCFASINSFATNEVYVAGENHLLKLESKHLDLLLDLLESKITIESYLAEYNLLFLNEELAPRNKYTSPLLFLEKAEIEASTIYIDEEVRCFANILRICSENIKEHIVSKSYEKISDEIYYNHNVPPLISSKMKTLVENYLLIECANCKKNCSKEMVSTYEDAWKEASSQFLSNIDFYV